MKIIVDASGGDNAPKAIVEGACLATKELSINVCLVGKTNDINEVLSGLDYDKSKIEIINANEVIGNSEAPVAAIKNKKDSSLVVGLNMLKDNKGDGFVSAGSTGAILSGAIFIVKRITGLDRPALAPIFPGEEGPCMVLDIGANVDCKPIHLVNFAKMGKVYFESILKVKNPSIALINNGIEEGKGNQLTKDAFVLLNELKGNDFNFVGNIEPRDIIKGKVNVLVCDGFVGNAILKSTEGIASSIFNSLKQEINSSFKNKIAGLLLKPTFSKFKKRFDSKEQGGAIILGVNGICVKAHGNSDAKAIKNAIKLAANSVQSEIIKKLTHEISLSDKKMEKITSK